MLDKLSQKKVTLSLSVFLIVAVVLGGGAFSPRGAGAYEEVSTIPCHWSYTSGWLYLAYTWKGSLVTPSNTAQTNIKTAFSYSVSDWISTPTAVIFTYDVDTNDNWLYSYYQVGGDAGYALAYCSPGNVMYANGVYKNEVGADTQPPSTEIRAATGHELGHAIGIGHGSVNPSLMGINPNPSTYYVPQSDDIAAVNHYY